MNIGIGFITKSAPQLNLFSFGFPMTILGTFFALYFSVDALQFVFAELIDEAIGIVKVVLGDLAMAENDQTQEKTQEPTQRDWKRPEKMEIFYLQRDVCICN